MNEIAESSAIGSNGKTLDSEMPEAEKSSAALLLKFDTSFETLLDENIRTAVLLKSINEATKLIITLRCHFNEVKKKITELFTTTTMKLKLRIIKLVSLALNEVILLSDESLSLGCLNEKSCSCSNIMSGVNVHNRIGFSEILISLIFDLVSTLCVEHCMDEDLSAYNSEIGSLFPSRVSHVLEEKIDKMQKSTILSTDLKKSEQPHLDNDLNMKVSDSSQIEENQKLAAMVRLLKLAKQYQCKNFDEYRVNKNNVDKFSWTAASKQKPSSYIIYDRQTKTMQILSSNQGLISRVDNINGPDLNLNRNNNVSPAMPALTKFQSIKPKLPSTNNVLASTNSILASNIPVPVNLLLSNNNNTLRETENISCNGIKKSAEIGSVSFRHEASQLRISSGMTMNDYESIISAARSPEPIVVGRLLNLSLSSDGKSVSPLPPVLLIDCNGSLQSFHTKKPSELIPSNGISAKLEIYRRGAKVLHLLKGYNVNGYILKVSEKFCADLDDAEDYRPMANVLMDLGSMLVTQGLKGLHSVDQNHRSNSSMLIACLTSSSHSKLFSETFSNKELKPSNSSAENLQSGSTAVNDSKVNPALIDLQNKKLDDGVERMREFVCRELLIEKSLQCRICGFRTDSQYVMNLHRQSGNIRRDGKYTYTCCRCNRFKSSSVNDVNLHIVSEHGQENYFAECISCNYHCSVTNEDAEPPTLLPEVNRLSSISPPPNLDETVLNDDSDHEEQNNVTKDSELHNSDLETKTKSLLGNCLDTSNCITSQQQNVADDVGMMPDLGPPCLRLRSRVQSNCRHDLVPHATLAPHLLSDCDIPLTDNADSLETRAGLVSWIPPENRFSLSNGAEEVTPLCVVSSESKSVNHSKDTNCCSTDKTVKTIILGNGIQPSESKLSDDPVLSLNKKTSSEVSKCSPENGKFAEVNNKVSSAKSVPIVIRIGSPDTNKSSLSGGALSSATNSSSPQFISTQSAAASEANRTSASESNVTSSTQNIFNPSVKFYSKRSYQMITSPDDVDVVDNLYITPKRKKSQDCPGPASLQALQKVVANAGLEAKKPVVLFVPSVSNSTNNAVTFVTPQISNSWNQITRPTIVQSGTGNFCTTQLRNSTNCGSVRFLNTPSSSNVRFSTVSMSRPAAPTISFVTVPTSNSNSVQNTVPVRQNLIQPTPKTIIFRTGIPQQYSTPQNGQSILYLNNPASSSLQGGLPLSFLNRFAVNTSPQSTCAATVETSSNKLICNNNLNNLIGPGSYSIVGFVVPNSTSSSSIPIVVPLNSPVALNSGTLNTPAGSTYTQPTVTNFVSVSHPTVSTSRKLAIAQIQKPSVPDIGRLVGEKLSQSKRLHEDTDAKYSEAKRIRLVTLPQENENLCSFQNKIKINPSISVVAPEAKKTFNIQLKPQAKRNMSQISNSAQASNPLLHTSSSISPATCISSSTTKPNSSFSVYPALRDCYVPLERLNVLVGERIRVDHLKYRLNHRTSRSRNAKLNLSRLLNLMKSGDSGQVSESVNSSNENVTNASISVGRNSSHVSNSCVDYKYSNIQVSKLNSDGANAIYDDVDIQAGYTSWRSKADALTAKLSAANSNTHVRNSWSTTVPVKTLLQNSVSPVTVMPEKVIPDKVKPDAARQTNSSILVINSRPVSGTSKLFKSNVTVKTLLQNKAKVQDVSTELIISQAGSELICDDEQNSTSQLDLMSAPSVSMLEGTCTQVDKSISDEQVNDENNFLATPKIVVSEGMRVYVIEPSENQVTLL